MQLGSEPWIPDKQILEICHCRSETILLTPNPSCEACSAFTHVAACTLALSPIRDTLSEGFSQFVTSVAAPVASGWSVCRVGLAPTGKRRLITAHTRSGPSLQRRYRYNVRCRRADARTPFRNPDFAHWSGTV